MSLTKVLVDSEKAIEKNKDGSGICEPVEETRTIVGLALDNRYVTQQVNHIDRLERFSRVNRDRTVEWNDWKSY